MAHTFIKILNVILNKDVVFNFKRRNNSDIPNAGAICLKPRYTERNSP